MSNVCVKVYVSGGEACSYGECGLPVATSGPAPAASSMSDPDTLPFAAAADPTPDEVGGIDLKGLDPATIALIIKLIELGLDLLAKWLANRKRRKAA